MPLWRRALALGAAALAGALAQRASAGECAEPGAPAAPAAADGDKCESCDLPRAHAARRPVSSKRDSAMEGQPVSPDFYSSVIADPAAGTEFELGDVARGRPVVVHLLRRFGWALCRAHARHLSEIAGELEALGVLLIAVGFDAKGYEGFVAHDPKLWTGDHLFVDKSKATYKALNAKKGSMFGLMKPAVIRAYNAAQGSGVNGNNENALEGLQMGGTYVIDAEGTMILVHRQKGFIDHPENTEVLEAARKAAVKAAAAA